MSYCFFSDYHNQAIEVEIVFVGSGQSGRKNAYLPSAKLWRTSETIYLTNLKNLQRVLFQLSLKTRMLVNRKLIKSMCINCDLNMYIYNIQYVSVCWTVNVFPQTALGLNTNEP